MKLGTVTRCSRFIIVWLVLVLLSAVFFIKLNSTLFPENDRDKMFRFDVIYLTVSFHVSHKATSSDLK